MARRKHYLGVDPGNNGGLCVITGDGEPLIWERMPDGKHRIIDWLVSTIEQYRNLVIVTERAQPMPKQGIVSSFTYGRHFALFEDTAILLKVPYHEVTATVWKRSFGLTSSKHDSVSVARRLFPKVELIPQGCRKEHDGIAEALLIAEWGRRKNL